MLCRKVGEVSIFRPGARAFDSADSTTTWVPQCSRSLRSMTADSKRPVTDIGNNGQAELTPKRPAILAVRLWRVPKPALGSMAFPVKVQPHSEDQRAGSIKGDVKKKHFSPCLGVVVF